MTPEVVAMFVVLEGLDRSGKTTQMQLLQSHLSTLNIPFVTYKYPDRTNTSTGPLIDSFLKGQVEMDWTAASLLLAANLYEMVGRIERSLVEGKWVLFDRYSYSSTAYSTARGLDPMMAASLCERMPEPDCIIFLSIHEDAAKDRSDFGMEIFEKAEFQRRVREAFEGMTKPKGWHEINIDGLDPHQVHEKVKIELGLS